MKIVCGNCGAKYSIADEKVSGRTFKIRCRKCSSAILVDGTSLEVNGSEGEDATAFDPGLMAVWHVVVGGDQQGPYPLTQIGTLLSSGQLDWEDYVWREGFEDWVCLKEVPELVSAFQHIKAVDADAASTSNAASPTQQSSRENTASMGADPFATGQQATEDAARASVVSAEAEHAVSTYGEEEQRATQASRDTLASGGGAGMFGAATASSSSMTGQRNENSVLFSLNNLQNLAGQAPERSSSPGATRIGQAMGEGSGLIDIRSIADAAKHVGASSSSAKNDIDDLLSIGSGGLGFTSPLTAPAAEAPEEPEPQKKKAPVVMMVGAAIIAVCVAVTALAFVFLKSSEKDEVAATPSPAAADVPTTTPQTEDATAAAAGAPTDTTSVGDQGNAKPGGDDETKKSESGKTSSRSARKARKSGSSKASSKPEEKVSAPAAAPTKKASSGGDIDSLLEQALGSKKSGAKSKSSGSLPSTPSRSDVLSALKRVQPGVKACGGGKHGVVNAKVVVAGSTGRVTSVSISGPFAGTPVASCAARVIKRARFKKFQQKSFVVNRFPYSI